MLKPKKQQFKNPFDLEDDQEVEIIQTEHKNVKFPNVHNPLPFNPYSIEKEVPNVKEKAKSKKAAEQEVQIINDKRKLFRPVPSPAIYRQVPTRDTELQKVYELDENGDPPLLQDIGINPQMIKNRIKLILRLSKPDEEAMDDPDLSGPIFIALCFGIMLLLSGKIHFGDIYAIFVVGNFLLYFLFNLMSQVERIPLYNMMSTLGYALIPMLIVGFLGIFTSLKGPIGILLSLGVAGWSSLSASNFVEAFMRQTHTDRKILLLYPLFLFYVSFAMIVIF